MSRNVGVNRHHNRHPRGFTESLAAELLMNKDVRVAVLGFVLLLPALVLVSSEVLALERPDALVEP